VETIKITVEKCEIDKEYHEKPLQVFGLRVNWGITGITAPPKY
jgi:hypothetical protein